MPEPPAPRATETRAGMTSAARVRASAAASVAIGLNTAPHPFDGVVQNLLTAQQPGATDALAPTANPAFVAGTQTTPLAAPLPPGRALDADRAEPPRPQHALTTNAARAAAPVARLQRNGLNQAINTPGPVPADLAAQPIALPVEKNAVTCGAELNLVAPTLALAPPTEKPHGLDGSENAENADQELNQAGKAAALPIAPPGPNIPETGAAPTADQPGLPEPLVQPSGATLAAEAQLIGEAPRAQMHDQARSHGVSETEPRPATAAATPADQIAPACLRLTVADGSRHISLQLTPKELGRVDITIDQPATGGTHVTLTVDRPETLARLERDHEQLAQALDRAGLTPDNRVVTYHLTAPITSQDGSVPPRGDETPAHHSAAFQGGSSQGQTSNGPGSGAGGDAAQNDASRQRRSAASWPVHSAFTGDEEPWQASPAPQGARHRQAGLNITA